MAAKVVEGLAFFHYIAATLEWLKLQNVALLDTMRQRLRGMLEGLA